MNRREAVTLVGTMGLVSFTGFRSAANDNSEKRMQPGKDNILMKDFLPTMKTIGILGGLGPQATIDLEMRIHQAAQQLIPPMQNSGYPPMVVQYYRHPPILLTENHIPVSPWQPDPRLLDVARNLGTMVDFLLIPSNGVHLFQKEIEQAAGCSVVSMIDATLDEVKKRKWKKIGVLGFMTPRVYTSRLQEEGITFETIDDKLQEKLNKAIMKVMEGREDNNDRATALEAIQYLRSKNTDGIIPGCTEIPFLLDENMQAADLVNPAQLLAETAVKYCIAD